MNWVLDHLGPQAIVYPGQQQHARAAIQALSGVIARQCAFSHLGWQKVNEDWLYLDAGGGVSAQGRRSDLEVRLPGPLSRYQVLVPDSQDRINAVRASLRLLSLTPDRIMIPLLAGVYRAALGATEFSLFLTGRSGTFKTALAALCQQHFGAAMDAGHLPAHFESTAGALEELAFLAKDALMVVDDFVPTGIGDGALHSLAERIFRSAGNRQGRNRLNGLSLDSARPPRALLLATGEDLPRGHSLRARLLMIPIGPGDVDRDCLSRCQKAANEGHLAMAMGAFLSWLADGYDQKQVQMRRRASELRPELQTGEAHARIPTALAELQAGWEVWLAFAAEIGAIDSPGKQELEHRCRIVLKQLAAVQARHSAAAPAPEQNQSKRSSVIAMMERPEGATVQEIMGMTGWQKHTVFGFLSLLRRRTEVNLASTKARDADGATESSAVDHR